MRWWIFIVIPVWLYLIRLIGGALWAMVGGPATGIDPPRSPRFKPPPAPRGFPVVPVSKAVGPDAAVNNRAKVTRAAPVPVQPVDAGGPDDGRREGETSNMLLDLIEPIFEVADVALEIADAASGCNRGVRESETLLQTPFVSPARPETAVDAVFTVLTSGGRRHPRTTGPWITRARRGDRPSGAA